MNRFECEEASKKKLFRLVFSFTLCCSLLNLWNRSENSSNRKICFFYIETETFFFSTSKKKTFLDAKKMKMGFWNATTWIEILIHKNSKPHFQFFCIEIFFWSWKKKLLTVSMQKKLFFRLLAFSERSEHPRKSVHGLNKKNNHNKFFFGSLLIYTYFSENFGNQSFRTLFVPLWPRSGKFCPFLASKFNFL